MPGAEAGRAGGRHGGWQHQLLEKQKVLSEGAASPHLPVEAGKHAGMLVEHWKAYWHIRRVNFGLHALYAAGVELVARRP